MWVLGLLCLLSVTAALPASESSELEAPQEPFINVQKDEGSPEAGKKGSSEEKIEEPEEIPELSKERSEPLDQENNSESDKEASSDEEKEQPEEISQPILQIPDLPELVPIVPPLIVEVGPGELEENKPESSEDKNEKDEGEKIEGEKEKESGEDRQENVEVTLEVTNPPSFWDNLFSWPPSFTMPSFFDFNKFTWPSIFGSSGRAQVVNPTYYPNYSNYRFVDVK